MLVPRRLSELPGENWPIRLEELMHNVSCVSCEAHDSGHFVGRPSNTTGRILDSDPLLESVVRFISESLRVARVAVLLNNNDVLSLACSTGFDVVPCFSLSGCIPVVEESKVGLALPAADDSAGSWVRWIEHLGDVERNSFEALETRLLVPLRARERLLGLISLGPKQTGEPFSSADLQVLRSIAAQTSLALENRLLAAAVATEAAERARITQEVEMARQVQERLFPQHLPAVPGLDYSGKYLPAQAVGGDCYNFILLANGVFSITIGDVSGKGITAALLMATLQGALRGMLVSGAEDLREVIAKANRLLNEASAAHHYATLFCAYYDATTRSLTYVNAGHNSPVLLRRQGNSVNVIRLDAGGLAIGIFADVQYEHAMVVLQPGDMLLAFTDGLPEAVNPAGEEWGEERLIEAFEICHDLSAGQTVDYLIVTFEEFTRGASQNDDVTLFVVKILDL
jgi:sigma-B regulation protein RsbU (phosphoserine phosphatase)